MYGLFGRRSRSGRAKDKRALPGGWAGCTKRFRRLLRISHKNPAGLKFLLEKFSAKWYTYKSKENFGKRGGTDVFRGR
ncbi:MAG: hypothetical protein ACI3WR_05360 [Oscillospiraceae bacterium]